MIGSQSFQSRGAVHTEINPGSDHRHDECSTRGLTWTTIFGDPSVHQPCGQSPLSSGYRLGPADPLMIFSFSLSCVVVSSSLHYLNEITDAIHILAIIPGTLSRHKISC